MQIPLNLINERHLPPQSLDLPYTQESTEDGHEDEDDGGGFGQLRAKAGAACPGGGGGRREWGGAEGGSEASRGESTD
jgi:hypothetical protein